MCKIVTNPHKNQIHLDHVGVTNNSRLVNEVVRRLCAELLLFFPQVKLVVDTNLILISSAKCFGGGFCVDAQQLKIDDEESPEGEAVDALGGKVSRLPDDFAELCATFSRLVSEASRSARLFVVLDGVEMLRDADRAHSLDWLPLASDEELGGSAGSEGDAGFAKFLLGAVDNAAVAEAARKRGARALPLGALESKARGRLVQATLARHAKKLDGSALNQQLRALVRKRDSHSPLYLMLACEELRVFGVFERLTERIERMAAQVYCFSFSFLFFLFFFIFLFFLSMHC